MKIIENPLKNKQIFWDVNIENLDKKVDKDFIIARVLDIGDLLDTRWLFQNYSREDIISTIKTTKLVSAKTANFFRIILNITDPILCLDPTFLKTHSELWMN